MLQRGVGPDVGGGAAADSVLRASIDSLGTTVDSLSGALSAVPDAGGGWATGLQVIATVIAAAAAVASWRSVTVSERASTRAQQRDDEERAWRLQGVRHVYYAATVRTPVHDAVRSFRSEAKGLFAREVEVFARLDELSDDANERAVEALDDYLHLHHQPFADAVAEAATAWDESPELGVELQGGVRGDGGGGRGGVQSAPTPGSVALVLGDHRPARRGGPEAGEGGGPRPGFRPALAGRAAVIVGVRAGRGGGLVRRRGGRRAGGERGRS